MQTKTLYKLSEIRENVSKQLTKPTKAFNECIDRYEERFQYKFQEKFQSLGIESLYEKYFLILNELKTNLMLKLSLQNYLQSLESLILYGVKGC